MGEGELFSCGSMLLSMLTATHREKERKRPCWPDPRRKCLYSADLNSSKNTPVVESRPCCAAQTGLEFSPASDY